jgi:type II secretory pathway component PulK
MRPVTGIAGRGRQERGFVLVSVLWILAILTVIAIGFQRRAIMDARAATFTLDHTRAMFMARGAVSRGIVELCNKAVIDELYKQSGRTGYSQHWANTMDMIKEKGYYTVPEGDEFSKEICKYLIRDEESLISINAADREFLMNIESLTQKAVRGIMKRRLGDPDAKELPQSFQTIEELREVEDIKDKNWFGTEKKAGLRDLLTCWGDGKININTASADVLKCIPELRSNVIDAIVGYRAGSDGELYTADDQDFVSLQDVTDKTGVGGDAMAPLQQHCKVDSQFFTITGIATLRQGKVIASCVATVMIDGGNANVIKWREELVES